jgi:hypothetical protein
MHAHKVTVSLADRAAYSLAEVAALTGFSMAFMHALIRRGLLRTIRVGRRRVVTAAAVAELLGEKELFGPAARRHQQPVAPAHPRLGAIS